MSQTTDNYIAKAKSIYNTIKPFLGFVTSNFFSGVISLISASVVVAVAASTGVGIPIAIAYAALTLLVNAYSIGKVIYKQIQNRKLYDKAKPKTKIIKVQKLRESFITEVSSQLEVGYHLQKIFIKPEEINPAQEKFLSNHISKQLRQLNNQEHEGWKVFKAISFGLADISIYIVDWLPLIMTPDPFKITFKALNTVRGIASCTLGNIGEFLKGSKLEEIIDKFNFPDGKVNKDSLNFSNEYQQALLDKVMIRKFLEYKAENKVEEFFGKLSGIKKEAVQEVCDKIWWKKGREIIRDFGNGALAYFGQKTFEDGQELKQRLKEILKDPSLGEKELAKMSDKIKGKHTASVVSQQGQGHSSLSI